MAPVDDPTAATLRELIARHQENAGAASAISILFAVVYAGFKRLSLRGSLMAIAGGALFASTLWVVLAEYLNLPLFALLPVAAICGIAAFPLLTAWVKEDDKLAEGVVSGAGNLLTKLLKRFTGNGT